ncbi:hypothetical protein CsatB_030890 [Cannabis sativa]
MALRALLSKKTLASGFQTQAKALASGISNSRASQTSLPSDNGNLHHRDGGHFNNSIFLKNLTPTREAGGEVKAEGAAFQGSGLAYKSFCRTYSSSSAAISNNDEKTTRNVLRPLSPHLPVYQPQLSSMLSIFNRISGSYLTALVLFNYLSVKIGWVSFTSAYFYQFMFYSSKLFPISVEIAALALSYHVIIGIQHLVKRA